MAEPDASELLGILSRVDISPTARCAWQFLLAETRAGRPWPSLARLAGTLGISERWAREVVRELTEAGEIHLDEQRRPSFPAVDGRPIRKPELAASIREA